MGHIKLISASLRFTYKNKGIAVVDSAREVGQEYLQVAFIDEHRFITFSNERLSPMQMDAIQHYATTADPTLALSLEKVFIHRPIKIVHKRIIQRHHTLRHHPL